ncbi:ankyrin repeat domain-containing protein [Flavobacterium sp. RHBU_3]|uniref:ankyrin repeat domain-containing protein n=1 Tax=Flavobacterium sp. RHBU_3 TaxID=3391184 RepID=UPI00398491E2
MEKLLILLVTVIVPAMCLAQGKDVFDTARSGTVDQMKILVQKNKDTINAVSPMGYTPLLLACYRGNVPVAEYLIGSVKDVNVNTSNGTALAAAVVKGNVKLAKLLLEHKANPNIADPAGVTPLVYAVQFENIELIKLLLQYKADPTAKDNEGHSVYDHAAFSKNEEIIKLFKK